MRECERNGENVKEMERNNIFIVFSLVLSSHSYLKLPYKNGSLISFKVKSGVYPRNPLHR